MPSIFQGHGYVLNDNRASGGIKKEYDILTCTHCQRVINATNWKAGNGTNGWCRCCNAPICGPCATKMLSEGCVPYIQQIERSLDATYRKQQLMKIAGLQAQPSSGIVRSGHT